MKPSIIVTSIFLLLVAVAHVLRLILQIKVTAGNYEVPMWMSIAAAIFAAALTFWLLQDNKKT
jgi:uncharacterized membrane protein